MNNIINLRNIDLIQYQYIMNSTINNNNNDLLE